MWERKKGILNNLVTQVVLKQDASGCTENDLNIAVKYTIQQDVKATHF